VGELKREKENGGSAVPTHLISPILLIERQGGEELKSREKTILGAPLKERP